MSLITWFKVDDGFAMHHKAVTAGNAALGLWVRAGAWSAQQLTDGFVPHAIARQFGTKGQADRLVEARLWIEKDDGYEFWQWQGRQPSRAQVEERREQSAKRVRDWRERQGERS